MPYIKVERRAVLDPFLNDVGGLIESPGELNYCMTVLLMAYYNGYRGYTTIAEVTGVLDNVSKEFYRRVALPYENEKRNENGDVYE